MGGALEPRRRLAKPIRVEQPVPEPRTRRAIPQREGEQERVTNKVTIERRELQVLQRRRRAKLMPQSESGLQATPTKCFRSVATNG